MILKDSQPHVRMLFEFFLPLFEYAHGSNDKRWLFRSRPYTRLLPRHKPQNLNSLYITRSSQWPNNLWDDQYSKRKHTFPNPMSSAKIPPLRGDLRSWLTNQATPMT